ncbi:MAG: hypothetical protein EP330_03040 [Deltaproteobacteria bacterium]|nr:MAG: hypothetical protein EP330_03040 [Deltaproteobacteria bacterium]
MIELHVDRTWDDREAPPEEHVTVRITVMEDALRVDVSATFHGDPAPPGDGSTWGLWEHEVVELFLLGEDERYTEIELGPHGHYLVLRLHGERQVTERELPIDYTARIEGGRWTGSAVVPRSLLPEAPWRGNAYAIHGVGEARRYLVHHPLGTDKPDFHAIGAFPRLTDG